MPTEGGYAKLLRMQQEVAGDTLRASLEIWRKRDLTLVFALVQADYWLRERVQDALPRDWGTA